MTLAPHGSANSVTSVTHSPVGGVGEEVVRPVLPQGHVGQLGDVLGRPG